MASEIVDQIDIEGKLFSVSFAEHKEGEFPVTVLLYNKANPKMAVVWNLNEKGVRQMADVLNATTSMLKEWLKEKDRERCLSR